MRWPPTDLQILEEIYRRYYRINSEHSKITPTRLAKVYVPINIIELAEHFGVDVDIIFGRLYYHLEPKYGFRESDRTIVRFFILQSGKEKHLIQFPLLSSVIAELREARRKHLIATWISISALLISVISVGIALQGSSSTRLELKKIPIYFCSIGCVSP